MMDDQHLRPMRTVNLPESHNDQEIPAQTSRIELVLTRAQGHVGTAESWLGTVTTILAGTAMVVRGLSRLHDLISSARKK